MLEIHLFKWKNKKGKLTIACNCNGALLIALVYSQRLNTVISHFCLIWSIYDLQKTIALEISIQHVEPHLDTKHRRRILNQWEKLNCEVDRGAKEYLQFILASKILPEERLYGPQWRVSIDGVYVHKKLNKKIQHAKHKQPLIDHMVWKGKLTRTSAKMIDWEAIEKAGKSLPQCKQTWLTKHISRFNATGRQMFCRK